MSGSVLRNKFMSSWIHVKDHDVCAGAALDLFEGDAKTAARFAKERSADPQWALAAKFLEQVRFDQEEEARALLARDLGPRHVIVPDEPFGERKVVRSAESGAVVRLKVLKGGG